MRSSRVAHLPELITDLAFILITAATVTLVFRYLKQPVVLGYIVAGILVGPHIPMTPTISDSANLNVWAEIGVIFLLFSLGLEFSFKKLSQVGKSASLIAAVEVVFMLAIGYLAGQAFGWSKMDSLFLGGILSISSTTIIVRAFEELGLKKRKFVSLVFGVLIVEDLFAILLLVLLSTVAATQSVSGQEMLGAVLKLGFFLVLWCLVGIYLLPLIFKKIKIYLTDETMLIVSIGLCLMMVLLATKVGFSPALGAFVMGLLLAETGEGKRIEHLLVPVRDLFAAVFFVSVGMLLDPKMVIEHFGIIVIVTLLTIFGKLISTGFGAIASGQSLKHSVQAGLSLAQIGEFSFIIATLGLTLKVTSPFLYPIAVAVSVLTTFTTPYLIKFADPFYFWIEARIPDPWLARLEIYRRSVTTRTKQGTLGALWETHGLQIVLNSIMVIAITLGMKNLAFPYVRELGFYSPLVRSGFGILTVFLCIPFLWPIAFGARAKLRSADAITMALIRFSIAVVLVGFVLSQFSSVLAASGVLLFVIAVPIAFVSRYAEKFYRFFEARFISNLMEKETNDGQGHRTQPALAPWDATLAEYTLSPNSELVAKTLIDTQLKDRFGVTVALIERGNRRIIAPGQQDLLLPYDRLFLIGMDDQLEAAGKILENKEASLQSEIDDSVGLASIMLVKDSPMVGKTIRNSGIRDIARGLIVGIERDGSRILNPDSGMILQIGDLAWVVGDRELIKKLN